MQSTTGRLHKALISDAHLDMQGDVTAALHAGVQLNPLIERHLMSIAEPPAGQQRTLSGAKGSMSRMLSCAYSCGHPLTYVASTWRRVSGEGRPSPAKLGAVPSQLALHRELASLRTSHSAPPHA